MFRSLLNNVKRFAPEQSHLLLAVSGGVDSMVMLDFLSKHINENLILSVAHVDHGLRDSSGKDLELVNNVCEKLEIPFYSKQLKGETTGNVEAWARQARYQFFAEIMQEKGMDLLLTAHTASDLVETFLMRLLSNKEPRLIDQLDPERSLLRPMLHVFRSEVLDYASQNKVQFREDETNQDNSFLRNRVRNKLLPFLIDNFNPEIEKHLYSRACSWLADLEVLDQLVADSLHPLSALEFGSKEWFRSIKKAMEQLPEKVHWRLIEEALKPQIGFRLGLKHARLVEKIFKDQAVAVQLPAGFELRRKAGGIAVSKSDL